MGGRFRWVSSALICLACSERSVGSGALPEHADFLPTIARGAPPDSEPTRQEHTDTSEAEQPRLILRCEQGRIGAYVTVGTPAGGTDRSTVEEVPVRLDSAPPC